MVVNWQGDDEICAVRAPTVVIGNDHTDALLWTAGFCQGQESVRSSSAAALPTANHIIRGGGHPHWTTDVAVLCS